MRERVVMKKGNTRDGPHSGPEKQGNIFYKGETVKMKKGTIILALMLSALSLSACGGNAAVSAGTVKEANVENQTEAEEQTTPSEIEQEDNLGKIEYVPAEKDRFEATISKTDGTTKIRNTYNELFLISGLSGYSKKLGSDALKPIITYTNGTDKIELYMYSKDDKYYDDTIDFLNEQKQSGKTESIDPGETDRTKYISYYDKENNLYVKDYFPEGETSFEAVSTEKIPDELKIQKQLKITANDEQ